LVGFLADFRKNSRYLLICAKQQYPFLPEVLKVPRGLEEQFTHFLQIIASTQYFF
jgi:hypothetical protein